LKNDPRTLKIYYFQAYARSEPLKMMLTYLEIPFKEIDFTYQEWDERLQRDEIKEE